MFKGVVLHIARFIVLLLVQGLIINELDLGSNIRPMIYLLAILLLPVEIPSWAIMFIAFAYGVCVDMFTSTIGLHTSACILIAFFRPNIMRLIAPRDGYEPGVSPTLSHMGWQWFISYAGIMILIHHTWLFFLEVFNFSYMWSTFARVALSSMVSLVGLVLIQYLFFRATSRS